MSTLAAIIAAALNITVCSAVLWGWMRRNRRASAIETGVARLRFGTEDIALRVRPGWVLFVRTLDGGAREAYVLDDPSAVPSKIAARLVRQRADLDGGLRGAPPHGPRALDWEGTEVVLGERGASTRAQQAGHGAEPSGVR